MKPFAALALLVTLTTMLAAGQSAASLFKGPDLALGEKLFRENKCAESHSRQVGGMGRLSSDRKEESIRRPPCAPRSRSAASP